MTPRSLFCLKPRKRKQYEGDCFIYLTYFYHHNPTSPTNVTRRPLIYHISMYVDAVQNAGQNRYPSSVTHVTSGRDAPHWCDTFFFYCSPSSSPCPPPFEYCLTGINFIRISWQMHAIASHVP